MSDVCRVLVGAPRSADRGARQAVAAQRVLESPVAKAADKEKAKKDGLPIGDLTRIDFSTLDSLVLSPGVPLTSPTMR